MSHEMIITLGNLTQNPNFWNVYADLVDPEFGWSVWEEMATGQIQRQEVNHKAVLALKTYNRMLGTGEDRIRIQPVYEMHRMQYIFYDSLYFDLVRPEELSGESGSPREIVANGKPVKGIYILQLSDTPS